MNGYLLLAWICVGGFSYGAGVVALWISGRCLEDAIAKLRRAKATYEDAERVRSEARSLLADVQAETTIDDVFTKAGFRRVR